MPTGFWKIQSYTVTLHHGEPPDYGRRVLILRSPQGFYRADIHFYETVSVLGSISIEVPAAFSEWVQSWWPAYRFAETYDVLRSETPVYLAYSWARPDDLPDATYGTLLQIGITSASRPWWETE